MDTQQPLPQRIAVQKLRTEYLENPLGIDALKPRLSWQIASDWRNVRQSAYQVQAAQLESNLAQELYLLWDSGKVASDRSFSIPFGGTAGLQSRQRYYWRVRVWDQGGQASEWSQPAWWEMGLLEEKDWAAASWIEVGWDEDPKAFKPCPFFRRSFTLDQPVRSARLYITAHGLYEAWLNGQRVGDQVFTPGYTPYDLRLQYQVYDVTALLRQGENALGAILGDGWYRGKVYIFNSRNVYGTRLGLLAQLVVETADGRKVTIATGPDWQSAAGPLIKSDMRDGEVYDARLEMPGWCSPGFDPGASGAGAAWKGVRVANHPKNTLVASMGVPVRRKETFHPVVLKTPDGQTVLDFGQNLAGVVRFRVSGPRGATVRLRHGEALNKEGNFTLSNLIMGKPEALEKNPFQEVRYTLKGEGVEEYEPRFTVHGFRYVQISGYPGEPAPDDFCAVAIYSDMPPAGTFECSDPLITRLHKNVEWSMKSNFLDLPTDCPQRERAGWTGDAQIFAPSASFLMDTRAFFCKWLKDLSLEQFPSGMLGNFVPNPYRLARGAATALFKKLDGSSGWGDAAVIIPWALYWAYGDVQFLERQYASMKAWVDYQHKQIRRVRWTKKFSLRYWLVGSYRKRQKLLWDTGYHWGEWLEPGRNAMKDASKAVLSGYPVVATAYVVHSARILSKTAGLLGKAEDAEKYHKLAERVKKAYIAEFIGKDGRIEPDKQASYVRLLAFDLAPEELKPAIVDHLVRLVRDAGNHIGTGFLSTVFLCQVLAENGRLDVAYDLLTQKTIPSWLYAVTKGATTIWEAWEGIQEDGTVSKFSLNHYSPGAVVNFLHRTVAGIEAAEPGYRRITIHPRPGGELSSASATYESAYGLIASRWVKKYGRMSLEITIPANTRALVRLPGAMHLLVMESGVPLSQAGGVVNPTQVGDDAQFEVGSGVYKFEYPIQFS
jgi:alpha-L-rhamnosidase